MRFLTLREVLELYQRVMEIGGGAQGIRDLQALQSSIAQPRLTFGGQELYEGIVSKAAALGYSLIKNHPYCAKSPARSRFRPGTHLPKSGGRQADEHHRRTGNAAQPGVRHGVRWPLIGASYRCIWMSVGNGLAGEGGWGDVNFDVMGRTW